MTISPSKLAAKPRWLVLALPLLLAQTAGAAIDMCAIFGPGMVLQADRPVPVWGQATPDEEIRVSFAGQVKTTCVDAQGEWALLLEPLPANCHGQQLTVETTTAVREFPNVLIGDVWICSGQSNMLLPTLAESSGGEAEALEPANPLLRLFEVPYEWAAEPATRQFPGNHHLANGLVWQTADGTTPAVPYYFGSRLHDGSARPIGLIVNAVNASPAEAWLPQTTLLGTQDFALHAETSARLAADYPKNQQAFERELAAWKQRQAAARTAGRPFDEPQPKIGMRTELWPRWWAGSLYNAQLAPLRNLAIRGVVWYQGENNAIGLGDTIKTSEGYQKLLHLLVESWRRQFEQPALPFLIVQLSMFDLNGTCDPTRPGRWSVIREAQWKATQTIPHTGLAVTWDIGEKSEIHPLDKRPVGERLAKLALRDVYGQAQVIADGPSYVSHHLEGNRLRIHFKNTHGGLQAKDGPPAGFAIAGEDRQFVWAEAQIQADTVVVSNDNVPRPVAVRFAYIPFHPANLFNQADLPMVPFRTGDWTLAP